MPGANQFLNFAQGGGANVLSQADYLADAQRVTGNQTGIARAPLVNKAALQASAMAAGVGQFLADNQALDVTDQKTPAELAAMFLAALATVACVFYAADTTYYVNGDTGNDANAGTLAAPFATVQHGVNQIAGKYLAGHTITVQVTAATVAESVNFNHEYLSDSGDGFVQVLGDEAVPTNVVWTAPAGQSCVNNFTYLYISGFKVTSPTGVCLNSSGNVAWLDIGKINFGAAGTAHMAYGGGGTIGLGTANYAISGGAPSHIVGGAGRVYWDQSAYTVTITGTPAFSVSYLFGTLGAAFDMQGATFVGSATGSRYIMNLNAGVYTAGGGASYLPGNIAGTLNTGGQYA